MSLTEKQREEAVRHIITHIHVPRMSLALAEFLMKFGQHIETSVRLSNQVGIPIMEKPPVFDYSLVTEQLIQDILMFEEMYNKSKEKPK